MERLVRSFFYQKTVRDDALGLYQKQSKKIGKQACNYFITTSFVAFSPDLCIKKNMKNGN